MPIGAPSAKKIIDAWTGVTDQWIVRKNKALAFDPWEVVHVCADQTIVDHDTQTVLARFGSAHDADAVATEYEMLARAGAVQAMIVEWNK